MGKSIKLVILIVVVLVAVGVYLYFPSLPQTELKEGFKELKAATVLNREYVGAISFDEFREEKAGLAEISGVKNQILEFKTSVQNGGYSDSEALNALADLLILKTEIFENIVKIDQANQGFNVTLDSSDEEICGKISFLESGKNSFADYSNNLTQFSEKKFTFVQLYSNFVQQAGLVNEDIVLEGLDEEKNKLSDSYAFFQNLCGVI